MKYDVTYIYFDVIVVRISEVRKGTSRNTNNEDKKHKYV